MRRGGADAELGRGVSVRTLKACRAALPFMSDALRMMLMRSIGSPRMGRGVSYTMLEVLPFRCWCWS
jgi:hypothetical protein